MNKKIHNIIHVIYFINLNINYREQSISFKVKIYYTLKYLFYIPNWIIDDS